MGGGYNEYRKIGEITLMKEKRIEKEIKKAQKKGIYNPKLKLGIVALILVIGTVIGVSYAYYTDKSTTVLTISGTVSKKITVTLASSGNGTVSDSLKIVDYGTQATFIMSPNAGYQYKSVSCNYNSSTSHSGNTLYITPKTSKDVTCTVEFEEIPYLRTKILKANTSKGSLSSDNFKTGCPTGTNDSCSGVYEMEDYKDTSGALNYTTPGGISYYFRGAVENNYVQFANKIWRIVRINGDGTIRLVLDGDIGTSEFNTEYQGYKYVGYTYDNGTPCTNASPCKSVDIATNVEDQMGTTDHGGINSTIKTKLEKWYYDNLRDYDRYIEYGTYCNDTSFGSGSETGTLYYGPYTRLRDGSTVTPQLRCSDPTANSSESQFVKDGNHTYGGVYKLKIGLLSGDEIVLAGFKPSGNGVAISNYLYYTPSSSSYFWNSSPYVSSSDNDSVFVGVLTSRNFSYSNDVAISYSVRPVINLRSDVTVIGDGTGAKNNPYVIST